MSKIKYTIDTDLGIEYADTPPWRSYHLTASGNTIDDLYNDITVSEVDQDGGDIDCYGIEYCSSEVLAAVIREFTACVLLTASGRRRIPVFNEDMIGLSIQTKYHINNSPSKDLYVVLQRLFELGYSSFTEQELRAINAYLARLKHPSKGYES